MSTVKTGDSIKIHYTGRLEDGTTFDSSEGRSPLEFEVGSGMVIKGFDDGVKDMAVGDKKTINIPAAEAYGERRDDMVIKFPKANFPADMTPEVGMQLEMNDQNGARFPVTITAISDDTIELDANHHLAGKTLIFDLELVEITPKSLIITP